MSAAVQAATEVSSTAGQGSTARRTSSGPLLRRGLGWIVLVALLVAWEVLARAAESSSVPTPTAAVGALGELLTGPTLVEDVLPSLGRVLLGFSAAGVLGVTAGLVLAGLRGLHPWVLPLVAFMRSVPPASIIPVVLLVLGLGPQVVVAVIIFGAFWPVLLNTFDGARRIDPQYLEVARAARISPVERLLRVVLPASLPTLLAGLRIALSISLILMVVAEILASTTGLGYRMSFAQQTFDVPATYGAVILLAVLGWAFDTAFVAVESRLLRWHPAFQGGTHG